MHVSYQPRLRTIIYVIVAALILGCLGLFIEFYVFPVVRIIHHARVCSGFVDFGNRLYTSGTLDFRFTCTRTARAELQLCRDDKSRPRPFFATHHLTNFAVMDASLMSLVASPMLALYMSQTFDLDVRVLCYSSYNAWGVLAPIICRIAADQIQIPRDAGKDRFMLAYDGIARSHSEGCGTVLFAEQHRYKKNFRRFCLALLDLFPDAPKFYVHMHETPGSARVRALIHGPFYKAKELASLHSATFQLTK
jgi:hypothetical protein